MNRTRWYAFMVLAAIPSVGHSQFKHLSFTALLSHDSYHTLGFVSGIDMGGSLGYRPDSVIQISGSLFFSKRSVSFDLIGDTRSLDARMYTIACAVEYAFLGHQGQWTLSALAGGGAIVTSTDAMMVSLGAAGTVGIPARRTTSGFLQTGLRFALPFAPRFEAVVQPALRFSTPISSATGDVSLAGGLCVLLL